MKRIAGLIFTLAVILFTNSGAIAQAKPKTEITSVKQKGETVRFTITSSKPFIFGNNRYVLYIGDREFTRNEQWKKNGKGFLSFLIPADAFKNLREDANIYLTYGHVDIDELDMEEYSKKSRKSWAMGKFSKKLLTK